MVNTQGKILIVDDDGRIRELLAEYLSRNGFTTAGVANVAQARAYLAVHKVDLIILDIMLPGETGLSFLASLRAQEATAAQPVILLTARGDIGERIEGLSRGADDYLAKPFEPEELLLRIRAVLRRGSAAAAVPAGISIGDFRFDLESGRLRHALTLEEIFLTSTEVIFLRTLAQAPNAPLSREMLAERAGYRISDRSIDVQITRLRKKLNDDPPRYLKTVRHVGYMLCPAG